MQRAHVTKLSRIYQDVNPCCDKCRWGEASLIYILWTWPSLEKYWTDVFQTSSLILNFDLELNSLVVIFGTTGEDDACVNPINWRTLSFASPLTRRAVLLRWRDAAPPTHAQWLMDNMSCLNLEKIHYSVCNSNKSSKRCGDLSRNTLRTLKVKTYSLTLFLSFFSLLISFSNIICTNLLISNPPYFYLFFFLSFLNIKPDF